MSDFEDRLAALDPAAGHSYEHRNLDALISRVTAQPRRASRRLWRNIELKIAGTLIAGSLVVAGTLAILQGAPSLPALALQNASGNFATASPKGATAIQLYAQFDFTPASSLSTSVPSVKSYKLQIPRDGALEAVHVASVFGVTGSAKNTHGNGTDWTVTSPSGSGLDYENSDVPQWYYSSTTPAIAPATESSTPVGNLPSQSTVEADAQRYLGELGFNYEVGSPTFSTSTTSTTAANGTGRVTTSTEDVAYTVVVGGVATDQSVNFSVGAHNVVAYASGPAFNAGSSYAYPLQSPLAGVVVLNAEQKSKYSSTSSKTSKRSRPPIVDVTLNSDTLSLQTYELTDGTWWLLPEYHYQGLALIKSGSSTSIWNELAIDPSYVHVNNSAANDIAP
ncbi:MAG: hypothetical protein WAK12_01105 [Acidimicrobiales bacterium]